MEKGHITYEATSISRDGLRLAMHCWIPHKPRAVVFYIHGTQSHAGWLFETGPRLSKSGIAIIAMDRRGSGTSEGERGDTAGFQSWVDDYAEGLRHTRERFVDVPLTVLGQSMGGSIAVGLALDSRTDFDALLLCTPALNHMHCAFDEAVQQRFATSSDVTSTMPIPLDDANYTTSQHYREFMRNDTLMLRECTVRTMAALYNLEADYMAHPGGLAHLPTALVLSVVDRIIVNSSCRDAFKHMVGGDGIVVELPSSAHFLEFSDSQEAFCGLILGFATTGGFQCQA